MVFEHEIQACKETDERVHQALGKAGEPPLYSTDRIVAEALAKEVGLELPPPLPSLPMFSSGQTQEQEGNV